MKRIGGGGRIRTYGPRKGTTVFKTAAFDHSATPPYFCFQRSIPTSLYSTSIKLVHTIMVLGK